MDDVTTIKCHICGYFHSPKEMEPLTSLYMEKEYPTCQRCYPDMRKALSEEDTSYQSFVGPDMDSSTRQVFLWLDRCPFQHVYFFYVACWYPHTICSSPS